MFHWSKKNKNDPKMTNRFKVEFYLSDTNLELPSHCVKASGVPKRTVNKTEHKYGQFTYKFPIDQTFDDISIKVVDIADPDIYATIEELFNTLGYRFPESPGDDFIYISKARSTEKFDLAIFQVNEDGKSLGKFTFINPWISMETPSELAYENGQLQEIEITLTFDAYKYENLSTINFD